jgi:GNAT superfamily N-acetyltransferase
MANIILVSDRSFDQQVQGLLYEYFRWVNEQLDAEFNIRLDIDSIIENDLKEIEIYFPPTGRLLLTKVEDHYAGIGFLTKLRPGVGEIRRMYVRPEDRRQGLGRVILETLIAEAKKSEYRSLLLDSPKSWKWAHSLYESASFNVTQEYPECEVPEAFREHWIFMELPL